MLSLMICFGCKSKTEISIKKPINSIPFVITKKVPDSVHFGSLVIHSRFTMKSIPNEKGLTFTPFRIREINLQVATDLPQNVDTSKNQVFDKIYFLLGYDKNNQIIFCFDTNNDGLYAGEKTYQISGYIPFIEIKNLNYLENGNKKMMNVFLRPDTPIVDFSKSDLQFLVMPEISFGEISFDTLKIPFALFNFSTQPFYTSKYIQIIIGTKEIKDTVYNGNITRYKFGDTIYYKNVVFRFDSIVLSGDTIFADKISKQDKNFGVDKLSYALPIASKNILSNKEINTSSINKYILLDFWGTWCKPCISCTPALKKINEKYQHENFQLISIARDESSSDVKNYLKKENISWINLFDPVSNPEICTKYVINAFPTFILIDPNGIIIERVTGADELERLQKLLSDKLGH